MILASLMLQLLVAALLPSAVGAVSLAVYQNGVSTDPAPVEMSAGALGAHWSAAAGYAEPAALGTFLYEASGAQGWNATLQVEGGWDECTDAPGANCSAQLMAGSCTYRASEAQLQWCRSCKRAAFAFDTQGVRIESAAALQPRQRVQVVPAGFHFIWPGEKVGHRRAVPGSEGITW